MPLMPFVCLFWSHSRFFSLIWRRHHYRWRATHFDICSTLMTIEQGRFFNVPTPISRMRGKLSTTTPPHWWHLNIFFKTTGLISTKLVTMHIWMKGLLTFTKFNGNIQLKKEEILLIFQTNMLVHVQSWYCSNCWNFYQVSDVTLMPHVFGSASCCHLFPYMGCKWYNPKRNLRNHTTPPSVAYSIPTPKTAMTFEKCT